MFENVFVKQKYFGNDYIKSYEENKIKNSYPFKNKKYQKTIYTYIKTNGINKRYTRNEFPRRKFNNIQELTYIKEDF